MRVQSLFIGQTHGIGTDFGQRSGVTTYQRTAFHEIQYRQSRRIARRARGRQHVIGPGNVIAHRFGRIAAQKNGACMSDIARQGLRVFDSQFKMLIYYLGFQIY